MITLEDYFAGHPGHPEITGDIRANATAMLRQVNLLLQNAAAVGLELPINPTTGTQVSGQTNGGWRPQACPEGAPNSSHKQGRGVDIYDPDGDLDDWIDDSILGQYSLYREAPEATRGWCHLTDRAPHSGRRSFMP
jgi:hypothetical protein